MFGGIISHTEEVANFIANAGGLELRIKRDHGFPRQPTGASVCVNGVCLTVKRSQDLLVFDVVPETLRRSNLGDLREGELVNLEASLRVGDQIGGHFVYGHVDATSDIVAKDPEGPGYRMWCTTPPALERLIVEKGYVALDGVSLTVAAAEAGRFAVALIPETLKRTTLGRKGPGQSLNIEADPVARYVAALVR
jgi:riboflavin synthase